MRTYTILAIKTVSNRIGGQNNLQLTRDFEGTSLLIHSAKKINTCTSKLYNLFILMHTDSAFFRAEPM